MKTKQVHGDPHNLVSLLHKRSDGTCRVKEQQEPFDEYTINKRHLSTPGFLLANPPNFPYVDAFDKMKWNAKPFGRMPT
jgi:hypothetical protein